MKNKPFMGKTITTSEVKTVAVSYMNQMSREAHSNEEKNKTDNAHSIQKQIRLALLLPDRKIDGVVNI